MSADKTSKPAGKRQEKRPEAEGLAARSLALGLIGDVLEHGRMLSDAQEHRADAVAALSVADRARAQRLAATTLRQLHRADSCLKAFMEKPPAAATRAILRMATVELCADGAAAHGVVNSAVTLSRKDPRAARQSRLVNAVLRRVAEDGPARWAQLTAPARLPDWMRGRAQAAYGARAVAAIEQAHDAGAPLDLTLRSADGNPLADHPRALLLPTGSVRLTAMTGAVSALPGYAQGAWWVQDAAAALPAQILRTQPGERVLDLCAAPGGKTLQLAATGADVTAVDLSERRMRRVRENLDRTGLPAQLLVADARDLADGGYDAILLDAPCSATGTIRRHPDLPFVRKKADVVALKALQADLLDQAVRLLKPGGRLVYCTCSLLPEEGEGQVAALLSRTRGLGSDPRALVHPGIDAGWIGAHGVRLRPDYWPDLGGMDGFFIAAFRKEIPPEV